MRLTIAWALIAAWTWAQNGRITTVAGGAPIEGPALSVNLRSPGNLVLDEAGNLFILQDQRLARLSTDGTISMLLETRGEPCVGSSVSSNEAGIFMINSYDGIAVDRKGDVHYGSNSCPYTTPGNPPLVAFHGVRRVGGNGVITRTHVSPSPGHFAFEPDGSLVLAERQLHRITRFLANGTPVVIAGSGQVGFEGDGGPANKAVVNNPVALTISPDGSIYFADRGNFRIRRIAPDGSITTAVGTGVVRFTPDGTKGNETSVGNVEQLAMDASGGLVFVDGSFRRVRRLRPDGIVETLAGNGGTGGGGDGGPALEASFTQPAGVAIGANGDLYVSDLAEGVVRKVEYGSGTISTIAGLARNAGEGRAALSAKLGYVQDIGADAAGNVYFVDIRGPRSLRKLSTDGRLTTLIDNFPGERIAVSGDGTVYFGTATTVRRRLVSGESRI